MIGTAYILVQELLKAENVHKDFQQPPPSSISCVITYIPFYPQRKQEERRFLVFGDCQGPF